MAEKSSKAGAAAPAAPKKAKRAAKPAVAQTAAPAASAPAASPPAKPATGSKNAAAKTVRVTQVRSPAGRYAYQRATLRGLGLDKMNRSRVLEDTPAVRGMIERVKHLIRVEPVA